MDRGNDLADVATVGRAGAGLAALGFHRKVDQIEVPGEQAGHRDVRLERLVNGGLRSHLHLAARRRRGALAAGLEAAEKLVAVRLVQRAQVELRARVLGNDVGLGPALADDAVHACVGPELLAHRVHRHEELDDPVQRVHAAPRPGRGMGRLAEELGLDLDDSEAGAPDAGAAASVDHHRGVYTSKHARLQQLHLSRAAFLRRRADHQDLTGEGQRPQRARQRRPRPGAGRGDDVVAAGVPDAGQRIVLAQDGDGGPGAAPGDGRPEGGQQAADPALDAHALLLEELGEPGVGFLLLEGELGMVVDPVRQGFQLVGEAIDRLGDLGLDGVGGAHFAAANSWWARVRRPGSARRSNAVMAMTLAAASRPSRASGLTAAASKAREWMGVPSGAILTSGWMVGTTWLTLPTSDEPSRSFTSGASGSPSRAMLARKASSSVWLRLIGS